MRFVYKDKDIVVAIKPPRILSTDEPGGMPELVRCALDDPNADIRTVHRLDRVVSGLMVFARSAESASLLSKQICDHKFKKEYLAVIHGVPEVRQGTMTDLLLRNKKERKTYIVSEGGKGVQEATLHFEVMNSNDDLSRVRIILITGRTHQIRAQFSGHGLPLVGDRKYSLCGDPCEIALWSHRLIFFHPRTGKHMEFCENPPEVYPWTIC